MYILYTYNILYQCLILFALVFTKVPGNILIKYIQSSKDTNTENVRFIYRFVFYSVSYAF